MPCIGALYSRSCVRFYGVQVNVADGAFKKRAFAVGEVKVPQADKFVRKALFTHVVDTGEETPHRVRKLERDVRVLHAVAEKRRDA